MKGREQAATRRHNELMSLAWHTAALPLMKKFPKRDELLILPPAAPKTAAQINDAMEAWVAAMSATTH